MFPAMRIVPLLQIFWTLFSIVSGMIYFQEYKGFNTLKAIMFPVGVLVSKREGAGRREVDGGSGLSRQLAARRGACGGAACQPIR